MCFYKFDSPKITSLLGFLKKLPSSALKNSIIVDTTTSGSMFKILSFALQKGSFAVLSNKKPFAESLSEYKKLQKFGGNRLAYETTVGAGLPVIKVFQKVSLRQKKKGLPKMIRVKIYQEWMWRGKQLFLQGYWEKKLK